MRGRITPHRRDAHMSNFFSKAFQNYLRIEYARATHAAEERRSCVKLFSKAFQRIEYARVAHSALIVRNFSKTYLFIQNIIYLTLPW